MPSAEEIAKYPRRSNRSLADGSSSKRRKISDITIETKSTVQDVKIRYSKDAAPIPRFNEKLVHHD